MFPGAYLLAILLSATGIALLDWRGRIAFWAPGARIQTLVAVGVGTGFLLIADAVAISLGVFVQGAPEGSSPLYLGITLAPELPLEEPVFLAFLSYLALVAWRAALRALTRGSTERSHRSTTRREGNE